MGYSCFRHTLMTAQDGWLLFASLLMTSIQDSGKTRLILDIPSSSGAGKRHTMTISIFIIMKMMMMILIVTLMIIIITVLV